MKIIEDFGISKALWYKIGGIVKYFIEVENKEDLLEAIDFLKKNNIKKYLVIGKGSNLLFPDGYFDGAVIQTTVPKISTIKLIDGNFVQAYAGELLVKVINFSLANNLIGLQWAGGLPGTVGAAVRGNAGAFGREMKDNFESAQVLQINTGEIKTIEMNKNDMDFSYRTSAVKKDKSLVIVSVTLKLEPAGKEEIEKAKQINLDNITYRKEHHPLEYPNSGSVFKNIDDKEKVEKILSFYPEAREFVNEKWHGKFSTAYIIKKLGLCGYKIGSAQISQKHNNFIVNLGGARYDDVISIIETVKQKFLEKLGFVPETEVEIITL